MDLNTEGAIASSILPIPVIRIPVLLELPMKEWTDQIGHWWLPEAPEQRFHGRLTFDSKEGAKLEATIENPTPFPLPKCQEYGVIHGLTTNGHKVSLIDCFDLKGPGWSSSGITTKLIFANLVFDGFHTPLDKPANLSKLWAHFPMLTNWVGMSSITVKREPDSWEEFNISCRKLPKISFHVDDTLKIEIQVGLSSLPWEGPTSEINLRNQVWVTEVAPFV